MAVFIGFLRAVNVGGHNKIKMEALRAACAAAGFTGAKTHLQSGNVVFASRSGSRDVVAKKLRSAIDAESGVDCEVVARTAAELRDVVARNPFAGRDGLNPSALLVMFLAAAPDPAAFAAASRDYKGPEEMHLMGQELYLYYSNGIGRSKLTGALLERWLGATGTARNWNTVTALVALAHAG